MIARTKRIFRLSVVVFLIISAAWLAVAVSLDEKTAANTSSQYDLRLTTQTPAENQQNVFIGLLGLVTAGPDQDFYEVGEEAIKSPFAPALPKLRLTHDLSINQLWCTTQYAPLLSPRMPCPNTIDLKAYVKANEMLLDRYRDVTQMTDTTPVISELSLNRRKYNAMLHINHAAMARYIVWINEGQAERAVKDYNSSIRFAKRLMLSEDSFVGFAIAMTLMKDLIEFNPIMVNTIADQGDFARFDFEPLAITWDEFKIAVRRTARGHAKWFLKNTAASSSGEGGVYSPYKALTFADRIFNFQQVVTERTEDFHSDIFDAVASSDDPQEVIQALRHVKYDHYTSGFPVRSPRDLLNPSAHVKTNILMNDMVRGVDLFETLYYQNQMAQLADFYALPKFTRDNIYRLAEVDLPVEISDERLCVLNVNGPYQARKCLYTQPVNK